MSQPEYAICAAALKRWIDDLQATDIGTRRQAYRDLIAARRSPDTCFILCLLHPGLVEEFLYRAEQIAVRQGLKAKAYLRAA